MTKVRRVSIDRSPVRFPATASIRRRRLTSRLSVFQTGELLLCPPTRPMERGLCVASAAPAAWSKRRSVDRLDRPIELYSGMQSFAMGLRKTNEWVERS